MTDTDILPAPVLNASPSQSKWEHERSAFLHLLPELLKTCPGQFVAIHERQVIDRDENLVSLAARVYARYGHVPIYTDLVQERPVTPVRIPRYKPLVER
jgi:hypothetical protein